MIEFLKLDGPTATVVEINTLYHGDNTRIINLTVAEGTSFKTIYNLLLGNSLIKYLPQNILTDFLLKRS